MVHRLSRIMTLAAVLALASLTGVGASPGAGFSLVPSSQTVTVGQVLTIDIHVDASGQELDTVEAHIDFDPDYLQIVNEDGSPITGIADDAVVPGSIATTALTTRLLNRVDNGGGNASIAYGIPPDGIPVNEDFILGTIRFKAVASTAGTPVTFHSSGIRTTMAVRETVDVTGDLTGATVTITADGTSPQATDGASLSVTIASPADGTVASNPVQVTGTVSDTSITAATLRVNDMLRPIKVANGSFGEEVTLASGVNTVSVSVIDTEGNTATARIEVTLSEVPAADAADDATVTTPAEEEPSEKPLTWPMMGGIIGGVLVIGLAVYFFVSRRSQY